MSNIYYFFTEGELIECVEGSASEVIEQLRNDGYELSELDYCLIFNKKTKVYNRVKFKGDIDKLLD